MQQHPIDTVMHKFMSKAIALAAITMIGLAFTLGGETRAQQAGASSEKRSQARTTTRRKRVRASNRRRVRQSRARKNVQPKEDWRDTATYGGS